MTVVDLANLRTITAGLELYNTGMVKSCEKVNEEVYRGVVADSDGQEYEVAISMKQPEASICQCEASKEQVVCKHMVALYFKIENEPTEE